MNDGALWVSTRACARPAVLWATWSIEMATATPNAEAVVFRDERLDYAGLKVRVDVFARALLGVGVRHGDRAALLITNRTE